MFTYRLINDDGARRHGCARLRAFADTLSLPVLTERERSPNNSAVSSGAMRTAVVSSALLVMGTSACAADDGHFETVGSDAATMDCQRRSVTHIDYGPEARGDRDVVAVARRYFDRNGLEGDVALVDFGSASTAVVIHRTGGETDAAATLIASAKGGWLLSSVTQCSE